jgi:hypothetical protein
MKDILSYLIPIICSTIGFNLILICIFSRNLREFWKEAGFLVGSVLFLAGLVLLGFKFFGLI